MPAKHDWKTCHGCHKAATGIGLIIFAGVLWYTQNWAMAIGVLGILAFLKGLAMHMGER